MYRILILFLVFAFSSSVFSNLHQGIVEEEYPVVILGSGVGALTAAIYLGRSGHFPVVITGKHPGGAITQSHHVENWPGEIEISGLELTEKMREQAERNGALLHQEIVVSVDFSQQPLIITTQDVFGDPNAYKKIKTQSCIIALGSTPNQLGVPGEEMYWSRGVYSCAVCDGSLYKNQVVAVVGGGDTALTEALYLTSIAKKVFLIVRGTALHSVEKKRIEQVLSRSNITVIYERTVQEIRGDGQKVSHLVLNNGDELPVNALFLAIGSTPNTALFANQLALDAQGYIQLKKGQETSIKNVFAVGDIADPEFKQAISAAGDGAKAALQVQRTVCSCQNVVKTDLIRQATGSVLEIKSQDELKQVLAGAKEVVFIDFYSTHCAPCQLFAPRYASWAAQFNEKITFLKVNADDAGSLLGRYHIHSVPTLIILDKQGDLIRKAEAGVIGEMDQKLSVYSKGSFDPTFFH